MPDYNYDDVTDDDEYLPGVPMRTHLGSGSSMLGGLYSMYMMEGLLAGLMSTTREKKTSMDDIDRFVPLKGAKPNPAMKQWSFSEVGCCQGYNWDAVFRCHALNKKNAIRKYKNFLKGKK